MLILKQGFDMEYTSSPSTITIKRVNDSPFIVKRNGHIVGVSARNNGMHYLAVKNESGWELIRKRPNSTRLGSTRHYPDLETMARCVPVFAALPTLLKMGCYRSAGM